MKFIAAATKDLPAEMLRRVGRYRHRVFVDRLGWALEARSGLEFDQFDRDDTLHLIALRDDGELIGIARLLPTDRPYLMAEVFPQLHAHAAMPCSPEVWELSRFATVDLDLADGGPVRPFGSAVAPALLRHAMCCAAAHGVKRLISVSPIGVERILAHLGFAACRAAEPVWVDGRMLFACWIDVPAGAAYVGCASFSAAAPAPPHARRPMPEWSRRAFERRS